jgi:hypothetical protein
MAFELPQPRFMPCPDCGASVARAERAEHVCDQDRWVDYNVVQLRPELDALEAEFAGYLETPQGRFAAWYAAQRRAA